MSAARRQLWPRGLAPPTPDNCQKHADKRGKRKPLAEAAVAVPGLTAEQLAADILGWDQDLCSIFLHPRANRLVPLRKLAPGALQPIAFPTARRKLWATVRSHNGKPYNISWGPTNLVLARR